MGIAFSFHSFMFTSHQVKDTFFKPLNPGGEMFCLEIVLSPSWVTGDFVTLFIRNPHPQRSKL